MSVTVVTQIQRVVVRGSGASYSDARVLAYLRSILTTNGDLLTVAAGTLARVGIGSSGQVLTVSGGAAVWAAPTGFANPMSAQGDLIIGGASGAATRLARGTNGQILSVSGSTLAWINAPTSYTDADAIAAIAGEVTDHQLIQRQNGTGLQGISLSTIYDGAIDAIEALGNGVLVTAGGVLDSAVGTEGQVLTWTGGTAVFAAASSGGMTNPMTTAWDLIRGGAAGTPTRLAVGSPLTRLSVLPDGTLGYAVGGGRITPGARESIWYTTTTAAPTSVGGGITWSRVSTTNTSGNQCKQNGSTYQINATSASANSHAAIGATLVSGIYWLPAYATVYMQSHVLSTTSTVGLYLASAATVSSNEFFNAPPTANAASAAKQGFGLMWSSADGLTGTWKFIATTTTEFGVVDTGVQWTTDGVTVRDFALMIWEGPTSVYGEIWDMGGTSPVRLWGGSLPIVSFATTGLQIVAWSLTKTLAASAAHIVHGMGSAGYATGLEAA